MHIHVAGYHDPSPGRARFPVLIAAWLLIAATVLIGVGLTEAAHAQADPGTMPSFTLSSKEPGQLVINWGTPDPAPTDYRLRWANASLDYLSYSDENEADRGNLHPAGGATQVTLNDLTPGETYKVQLRARYYNSDRSVHERSGPWTAEATQRVKDHPPAAPTGLTASLVAHDSLTLTWDNPQDGSITGYRIMRGTDAGSLSAIEDDTGSAGTEYTDTTVAAETTYHYAVLALSQDSAGSQSAAISVTTPAAPGPAAPTGLTASRIGHDSVTLAWDDPGDASITGYRVMRGSDAGSLSAIEDDTGSAGTEYTDTTVAAGTTYHYAVLALSENGAGAQSAPISVTTPAAPGPSAPTGLTASRVGHDSLTLTWDNLQDANITGYRIMRGTDVGSLSTIEANTENAGTEYTDTTVAAETTYHYAVLALSQGGAGAQSAAISVTTPEPAAAGAITGLSLTSSAAGELTMNWETPDPEPSDYRVSWAPADQGYLGWRDANEAQRGNAYPGGRETSLTLRGLPPGAEYKVQMRARYFNDGDTSPQWSGPWQEAIATLSGRPKGSRELLWSQTMTVEELDSGWPVINQGFRAGHNNPYNPWRVVLPDGTILRVVVLASAGAGGPFYWSVLPEGTTGYDHALVLVVDEEEFAFADAMIVAGSPLGRPYVWPEGGQDWTAGESVELQLYHLPGAPEATLPRVEQPGRITGVTLVPTETGELTVAWDAPANAATANVLDYPVYLKREAGDWSAAERRVFTPTGEPGERLGVAYSGLEPGVEYRAGVYARNVVALGAFGNSKPVPAPERTPATLSSMSLTGTSELHFAPHQAGYLVRVDPGVTQTTVRHETAEAGATSEVMVVRTDGPLEADTEDGDPNSAGHQARLSSNGDTAVLVRVTSADGVRQEMFGAILDQSANAPVSSKDEAGLRARSDASTLKRPPAGTYTLTLSYGDQSFEISSSKHRYRATVPHDVGQVTVTATVPYGSSGLMPLGDADYSMPGLQVNLQASHPGGRPVQTAFVVVITQPQPLYIWCKLVFITVTRPPPTETDATLKSLELTGAELSRSFLYDFLDYTASASHDTGTGTIAVAANQPGATVAYDPVDADDTADDYQRALTAGDNNPVTITVTAPDGTTTQNYTVTINRAAPPSTDATLGSLAVADATIRPSFQSGVTTYAATVASRRSLVTLHLATGGDGATVAVNPPDANPDVEGWQIPVEIGANTVTITVTAENGTTTGTYTLTVTRNSLQTESAPLGSLAVAGATLVPEFNAGVLSYAVLVGNDTAQVTLTAAGEEEGSGVAYDQTDQDAGTEGQQVSLAEGRNVVIITVTSMDGMKTREYALTVFRTPTAADTEGFLQVDAGWRNFCGLRVDHTLACTSTASVMDLRQNIPEGVFERVSVKRYVGCGLRADGSQQCWGDHAFGSTGVKTNDFSKSAEYGADICVLEEDGDILCHDPYYTLTLPAMVEGPVKAIGQTRRGVCAIRSDDLVRCWGYLVKLKTKPPFGSIDMPAAYRDTEFKFISGGYGQACGIRMSDNAVRCWRWDISMFWGTPYNTGIRTLPAPSGEFSFVDTGFSGVSCGVRVDGTVDCWDANGSIIAASSNPPGETDIGYLSVTLEMPFFLICGLRKDSQIKCWNPQHGVIGTGFPNDSPWRSNAQLLGMDLGGMALSTAFDRDVFTYTASAANEVASVTVKPVLTNSLSFHAIYSDTGGAAGADGVVALAEGANVIRVHVISADRTASNTYTVTVTRAAD